jgi:hypothetical protein
VTPRPYLSWTQLNLWEQSSDLYRRRYLLGEVMPPTPALAFGKRMADILETDEQTEDVVIERVKTLLPFYPRREHKLWARCVIGGEAVPLFCIFDGYDPVGGRIGEFKTGRHWTQQMADEHGQLTFYTFAYWKKYDRFPRELALIWIETEEAGIGIRPTGRVSVFPTTRTRQDMGVMQRRIGDAWEGIKALSAREWSGEV